MGNSNPSPIHKNIVTSIGKTLSQAGFQVQYEFEKPVRKYVDIMAEADGFRVEIEVNITKRSYFHEKKLEEALTKYLHQLPLLRKA